MATLKARGGNAIQTQTIGKKFDIVEYANSDIIGNLIRRFYSIEAFTQTMKNKLLAGVAGLAAMKQGLPWIINPQNMEGRQANRQSLHAVREDYLLMTLLDGKARNKATGETMFTHREAKLFSYAAYENGRIAKQGGEPAQDSSIVKCYINAKSIGLKDIEIDGLRFHLKVMGSFITGAKETNSHLELIAALVLINPSAPRELEYENGVTVSLRFGYSEVAKLDASNTQRTFTKEIKHINVLSLTTAVDLSETLDNKATQEDINETVIIKDYTVDADTNILMTDIIEEIFQDIEVIQVGLLSVNRPAVSDISGYKMADEDGEVAF